MQNVSVGAVEVIHVVKANKANLKIISSVQNVFLIVLGRKTKPLPAGSCH
jgi:hypothetical protein